MREMEVTTLVMLDEKEEKKGNREMLRAVRNIKVGEEITISYRWEEQVMKLNDIFLSRNPIQENFITRQERRDLLREVS